MIIGIIGNGDSENIYAMLANSSVKILIYDTDSSKCIPLKLKMSEMQECDLIFICIRAPIMFEGSSYIGIIKAALHDIRKVINILKENKDIK